LIPGKSPYEGRMPILLHILISLPSGPKAIVVNYRKEDVMEATSTFEITYCEQPSLNGTGGALLAARSFLEWLDCDEVIITMGDVPFVKRATYIALVKELRNNSLVVLGFRPEFKENYGVLEINGDRVQRIIEWQYWKTYPLERQKALGTCNSGIYAVRKKELLHYLLILASRPHMVQKEINGRSHDMEEFFITDLVEYIYNDDLPVGHLIAEDEEEVMGVDDLSALIRAQEIYRLGFTPSSRQQ